MICSTKLSQKNKKSKIDFLFLKLSFDLKTLIIFKLLILCISVLVLNGCMRHKPHDPQVKASIAFGDDADFDVQASGGFIRKDQAQMLNVKGWSVPSAQTFVFFTEVSDTTSRNSLRDFPFQVLDEDGNEICQPALTSKDAPKCRFEANARSRIEWFEQIPYDHFKSVAEPVRIIRKIKGLGARRGSRTIILEINPWSVDRSGLDEVRDLTFSLTESEIEPLVKGTYRSRDQLRFVDAKDSSELVVMNVTTQRYASTEPLLVSRYDANLKTMQDEFHSNNLFFTSYNREEFFKRREAEDQSLPDDLEFVSEINRGQNKFYVYKLPDEKYPVDIDGFKFDFTVQMKLGYRYPNLNKPGFSISEITDGRFRVHAHLILEPDNGTQPVLLTPGLEPKIEMVKRANDLQFDYKAIVPYFPSTGVIKLALRIYPQGIGQGLEPLDRLFTVGPFNKFVGKDGGLLEDDSSRDDGFKFDEYVQSALSGEDAYKAGYVDVAREFQFDDMSVKFSTIQAGETAAQRTVIFKVETRVMDELASTSAGDNVAFEVVSVHTDYNNPEIFERWKVKKLTDAVNPNDPCRVRMGKINWFDTITHKYYQTEQLVDRYVFIAKWRPGYDLKTEIQNWVNTNKNLSHTDLPPGVQRLKILMNPWDEKFGTFGQDARVASQSFLDNVRGRDKIEPRFFIGDYGYETLRFRYKIDKDMHLNVKKTVLLNLKPLVLRYSSILEGINSVYNLRDGIYLMKTAIQKDYLDPSARNEKDIFAIPFDLPNKDSGLLTQPYDSQDQALTTIPGIDIQADNGNSQVQYGDQPVGNTYIDGVLNPNPNAIPYGDPRRKRAMSMVKKLVRVNAGRVITPVEFSVDDLRLMRIRQQFFVQLEPVNQVRLQMVNLVKERFEQIFQISLGEESPILSKMSDQEKERVKFLMSQVLDAIASSVSDDVYISSIKDLESIFLDQNVTKAMNAFESSNFKNQNLDMRLKDILREIKTDSDEVLANEKPMTDTTVQQRIDDAEAEALRLRQMHDQNLEAMTELQKKSALIERNKNLLEKQCNQFVSEQVYYDPGKANVSSSDRIDAVTKALIPFDTGIYPKDYSDNISRFQPFENSGRQFFESLVNNSTLNDILKNDFTQTPAFGAVSDLNIMVDKKSGIKGRTFVGPVTFLYNTNHGSLRPTDNLDEAYCETDDCNSLNTSIDSQYGEIQNFGYEKSRYHGSIAHFQGVTFNDQEILEDASSGKIRVILGLETMYKNLVAEKQARKRVDTLLTRYLDHYDMSYVSLNNKPIDRLICTNNIASDTCYEEDQKTTVKVDDFLSEYTKTVNDIVNVDYQSSQDVLFGFQDLETSERTNNTIYHDAYVKDYDTALPWGFISPRYNKGMDRCNTNPQSAELQAVCSDSNEHLRLGGLLGRSYQKEAIYLEPTKSELEKIIRYPFQGQQMVSSEAGVFDISVQSKMCDMFIYGEIGRKAKSKATDEPGRLRLRKELFELARRCKKDVNNGLSPIAIERKFRIFKTGRYYFLGGKSMNINASRDVKLSTSIRVSRNFGFRPLRIITGVVERGSAAISRVMALVLGSFDFSYSIQRDRTFNEGTGISAGTYLVMQNAEFEVELTSYEQCLTVRWHPDYAEKYSQYIDFNEGPFSEDYVRALYLCSGVTEDTPIAVNEKYYYFTQHFTEGDMLDPADIHNHPWLLSLRGVREFRTFMLSLQAFEKDGDDYNPKMVQGHEMIGYFDFIGSDIESIKKRVNGDTEPNKHYDTTLRQEWPIHQMVNTYKDVMPTFPGTYSQLSEADYYDRSWPWETGTPGSVMEKSNNCTK